MMKSWIVRNSAVLYRRFPKLSFAARFVESVTTRSIAIIAVEEFLIVLACTLFCMYSDTIAAWYCCLAAFGIHLVIHLLQFLVWRNYIPAIITTLLCLPYCVYAINSVSELLTFKEFVVYTAVGVIAGSINLFVMHIINMRKQISHKT